MLHVRHVTTITIRPGVAIRLDLVAFDLPRRGGAVLGIALGADSHVNVVGAHFVWVVWVFVGFGRWFWSWDLLAVVGTELVDVSKAEVVGY